ncbi:MAG: hypothetical protein IH607_07225 [Firmicutes bacterium]|nr:hypothetical protein [Bacillota bacterium]
MENRRAADKAVLLVLCWMLSFAAMSISLYDKTWFSFFMQVFVPVMLIFGYLSLWPIPRAFGKGPLWIAAAVFAAAATVGASFEHTGTAALVTGQIWKALIYFLGRLTAFYMGMVLALEVMIKGRPPHRRYPAGLYALFVLLCWLPYLVALWPGSVSAGAALQMQELSGALAPGTQEPLLQTGLIGLALWIGQGVFGSTDAAVALFCVVQALLMAWLIGRAVVLIAGGGAPKWLILASLFFFALCPVFPLYAFAVSADTSFALAALWLMTVAWRAVSGRIPTRRDGISLSVSAVLCALFSNFGLWVALGTLAALLVWSLLRRGEWRWSALYALACAAGAWIVVQGALLPHLALASGVRAGTSLAAGRETAALHYGYLMPGFVSRVSPTFIWGADGVLTQSAAAVSTVFARLLTYAPFRILASPGLYGWIALFALAVVLSRKRWDALVYLAVPLWTLAGCLFADVNGAMGYALPICLAAPVLLAAAARALRLQPQPAL